MDINKFKDVAEHIVLLHRTGAPHDSLIKELIEYLYEESEGRLLQYILLIDDIKRAESQKEKEILYGGLEDAMHGMTHYSGILKESKQPLKEIKNYDKFLYDNSDGNIAFLIRIARAYFPDGTYGHASNNGVLFFNQFRDLLRKNKDKYIDGESTEWAKQFGYYDYIKLVLGKDSDNIET